MWVHFALLSTIDTQKSKLGVRLVLEVLAKLMVGENSSWESYIRGASYIRDKTVVNIMAGDVLAM